MDSTGIGTTAAGVRGNQMPESDPSNQGAGSYLNGLLPRHSISPSPTRSPTRLYCLEPIGIDTPLVESLLSYITRLAAEHCVAPMRLIAQEIGPHVGKRYASDERVSPQFFSDWRHALALCGSGPVAHDWVSALERLTGRHDLSRLTLVSLDRVVSVPAQATLRRRGRWCPRCYDAWRCTGSKPYGPLLWMIDAAVRCPIHQTPFVEICPNASCRRTATWLISQAQRGRCPHCGCWLGERSAQGVEPETQPVSAQGSGRGHDRTGAPTVRAERTDHIWQQRASESIGVLLAIADRCDPLTQAPVIQQALSHWQSALPMSVCKLLQRRTGVTQRMLQAWSEGNGRPSLPQVLRLCHVLKISADDLIWSDAPAIRRQVASVAQRFEHAIERTHGASNG